MNQRLVFKKLGGVRHDQYVGKLRQVAEAVSSVEGRGFKAFRANLRGLGIWDKEQVVDMLSLVDLAWDRKSVTVGPLCSAIAAADGDEAIRTLLFERLKRDNLLLLKYVLGALDVESGGRLHSVHELYRMVTSYVYPGEFIKLPDFQAWLDWLAATGAIKIVGIRWALAPRGLAAVGELNAIDVEELLEDWEEARAEEAKTQAPGPEVSSQIPSEDFEPEPTLNLPEPLQGETVDLEPKGTSSTHRQSSAAAPEELGPASKPAPPYVAISRPRHRSTLVPALAGDATIDAPILKDWFAQWAGWPEATAERFDVDIGPEGLEGDALLLELGGLAVLREGLEPSPTLFAAVKRMRQAGTFSHLQSSGLTLETLMESVRALEAHPWFSMFRTRLYAAYDVKQRLENAGNLFEMLQQADSGVDVLMTLHRVLFLGQCREAAFWVVRECARLGVLDPIPLAEVCVVPCQRTLHNAHWLGLIDSASIADLPRLIQASQAIAHYVSPSEHFGLEVTYLDRALG